MTKRIVIIGAGAAGMSTAKALSASPDFNVSVIERTSVCGGMATSVDIDSSKFGASYINDGVQGCSPQFYNTLAIFAELGFKPGEVPLQVSFGREVGEDGDYWSNLFPSDIIDKYSSDIKQFGWVLKVIKNMEPIFIVIPVEKMLGMFQFSPGFGDTIVYPLVALFMGTGQQTPYISSVILERLFLDPSMKLFEYDPDSFLGSVPPMRAFPCLQEFYEEWKKHLQTAGVRFMLEIQAISVKRRQEGIILTVQSVKNSNTLHEGEVLGEPAQLEFDDVVFACDADTALKILGDSATFLERRVLGNVKYLYDVSVTHCDKEYMEKYYRLKFSEELFSKRRREDPKEQEKMNKAKENFNPLYFVRSYPSNKKKIEMSFDLTQYQPQFNSHSPRIYQTIFLDRDDSSHLWTDGEIDTDKIILKKWWKQQSHRWQHYGGTVPWMMFINGKYHTYFAGGWTVLNMHEIAIASGFAAAYQLGARYPYNDNDEARRLFAIVLAANHGARMRSEDRKGVLY